MLIWKYLKYTNTSEKINIFRFIYQFISRYWQTLKISKIHKYDDDDDDNDESKLQAA